MNPIQLHEIRSRAGRIGGNKTKENYGLNHFVAIGSSGGRPGNKTIEELMESLELQGAKDKKKIRRNEQLNSNLVADTTL